MGNNGSTQHTSSKKKIGTWELQDRKTCRECTRYGMCAVSTCGCMKLCGYCYRDGLSYMCNFCNMEFCTPTDYEYFKKRLKDSTKVTPWQPIDRVDVISHSNTKILNKNDYMLYM